MIQDTEEVQLYYIPECDTDKSICVCVNVPDHIYGVDKRFFLPKSKLKIIDTKPIKMFERDVEIRTNIITIDCEVWLLEKHGVI